MFYIFPVPAYPGSPGKKAFKQVLLLPGGAFHQIMTVLAYLPRCVFGQRTVTV